MPPAWNVDHNTDLYRGILSLVLPNRSTLYSRPDLADVNGHGGDTINKKLQQVLKELGKSMNIPDAKLVFEEEIAKAKRGGGKVTPQKPKSTPTKAGESSSKKRKTKGSKLAEEEEEEEAFWMNKADGKD